MALKTTLEQIEEVQAAISRVMSAQSIGIDGDQHRLADLEQLTKREEMLLAKYRAEQGTGGLCRNYGLVRRC